MEDQKRNERRQSTPPIPSPVVSDKKEDDEVVMEEENSEESEVEVKEEKDTQNIQSLISKSGLGLSQSINNKVASQITDSFLFGDDIKIPVRLDNKILSSCKKLP